MSEPQARSSAPRGRGSGRGGRGGYNSSRGGRPKQSTTESTESPVPTVSYDDQGEIGQLKKKHNLNIMMIKEMFPQYTDDDIVFALEENDGDAQKTIERITEGQVTQFGVVKKKTKERVPSKAKDAVVDSSEGASRGGRSRGDGTRGSRARGTERGRGRGRTRDGVSSRKPTESGAEATTTTEDGWDASAESRPTADASNQATTTTSEDSSWDVVNVAEAEGAPISTITATAPEQPQASSKPDGTRTWASMVAQKLHPKPVVATPKAAAKAHTAEAPIPAAVAVEPEGPTTREEPPIEETPATLPSATSQVEPAVDITPSEDQLTESNLQQVPGSPDEPATATVISNAGTNEIRTISGVVTPLPGSTPNQQTVRPGLGGYQTSALKATIPNPRSSSFARRVKEQQEAVVMPGNHAVDRTAVQFGSLGLGSTNSDLNADDNREQPETRAQPPQHSPVAPKASLPSVPQQAETSKMTPNLPAAGAQQTVSQDQQNSQNQYAYNQFGNAYGYAGQSNDPSAQKGYDQFAQQTSQTGVGSSNGYPSNTQTSGQPSQAAQHSSFGGFGSGNNDYSSYYSSEQQRNAYGLYGSYGQSQAPTDSTQKNATAFGSLTSASELPATTATSQSTHSHQTRFGGIDQTSGHSTPNPQGASQAHAQGQQAQHGGHNNQHSAYPYGSNPYYNNYYPNYMNQHSYGRDRPPFDDVRRYEEQFMNQSQHYGYGGNQAGYGGGPYGGGKYGQPHQSYGMPSQAWDGHAGSPAATGSYGQQPGAGRDGSAHGAYGRAGSTQPSESQQTSNTYGGSSDAYGRSASTYGTQTSYQQNQQSSDDTSRTYADSKAAGPSPAPGQNTGRPASAVNTQGSQGQHQQNYGSYPGQQSHYSSAYGQGTSQAQQTGGYAANYPGFGGSNYYGGNTRNWGGNYGQGH